MRGELLNKALETLGDAMMTTGDFMAVFLTTSKADYRALRRIRSFRKSQPVAQPSPPRYTKHQLYDLLYRMERDGLATKTTGSGTKQWKLTFKGFKKKELLSHRNPHPSPACYPKEESIGIIVVSYDIPEQHASKRQWIRSVLTHLDFRLLHKSVWIGKTKIPSAFIEDLRQLKLFDYIEIFSVSNKGTIRHIA